MKNTIIEGATRLLGVEQGYEPLVIRDGFLPEGPTPVMTSEWQLTNEEFRKLMDGSGRIHIQILGTSHPPIKVDVVEVE